MLETLLASDLVKQLAIAVILIVAYKVVVKVVHAWINTLATSKQVSIQRKQFILKAFNVAALIVFGALFFILLGIGFGDIALFLSSIFAVLGVALVAQWSILSNVTASVLIFFAFPYRIGDRIQVVEKDADIRGKIIDITMFHVLIRHESGEQISYPNNLILQKGVVKLKADGRSQVMTQQTATPKEDPAIDKPVL
ncbi:mechanosensitive ion channel family protein [Vibrio variabilis]|uniref:mechanosensitive ion channel family protein n=1 Tax=Vibrio variabilis TaxID=990271 RepID=UPI000DD85508|nr:mechanosensitive ion channel family protein [Vibrio variabilis]